MTTTEDKTRLLEKIRQARLNALKEKFHREYDAHDRQTVDALKGGGK